MMKIKLLICLLLISLLVIAGCKQTTVEETVEEPEVIEDVVEETVEDVVEDEPDEVEAAEGELPDEIVQLLEKARGHLKNVEYIHRRHPTNQEIHGIKILDGKIKYTLPEEQRYFAESYFDTVYLDTVAKTAIAYCEHRGIKCESSEGPTTVNYGDFIDLIVYEDWIDTILKGTNYVSRGKEQLYNRNVKVFDIVAGGFAHRISIDDFSGIPMRIEIQPDSDWMNQRPANEYTYEIVGFKNRPGDMEPSEAYS